MAVGEAGITMDDAASHRTSQVTDTGGTTGRHSIEVTMGHRAIADRDCGLTSAAAETRRGTPRRIRPLKHGTTARRTSPFRMGCASRTGDVRSIPAFWGGRLRWRPRDAASSRAFSVSVASSGCGSVRRKLEISDGQTSAAARLGSPVWKSFSELMDDHTRPVSAHWN
jgi:hypothetical protein